MDLDWGLLVGVEVFLRPTLEQVECLQRVIIDERTVAVFDQHPISIEAKMLHRQSFGRCDLNDNNQVVQTRWRSSISPVRSERQQVVVRNNSRNVTIENREEETHSSTMTISDRWLERTLTTDRHRYARRDRITPTIDLRYYTRVTKQRRKRQILRDNRCGEVRPVSTMCRRATSADGCRSPDKIVEDTSRGGFVRDQVCSEWSLWVVRIALRRRSTTFVGDRNRSEPSTFEPGACDSSFLPARVSIRPVHEDRNHFCSPDVPISLRSPGRTLCRDSPSSIRIPRWRWRTTVQYPLKRSIEPGRWIYTCVPKSFWYVRSICLNIRCFQRPRFSCNSSRVSVTCISVSFKNTSLAS